MKDTSHVYFDPSGALDKNLLQYGKRYPASALCVKSGHNVVHDMLI